MSAVTYSGMGTWGLATWERRDSGTRGRGDSGTWGCETQGLGDAETWGLKDEGTQDVGTRGHDKQGTPDFCAEFVKYSFQCS